MNKKRFVFAFLTAFISLSIFAQNCPQGILKVRQVVFLLINLVTPLLHQSIRHTGKKLGERWLILQTRIS